MAVGFFTRGIEFTLPHPKIQLRTTLLICSVIEKAWCLLKETPPSGFNLSAADEDTITQMLVEIIENRLRKNGEIEGFNSAMFGRVTRDQKITNHDKKHPDKMPDIFFDLKRDQLPILGDQDGLFVECKPVDKKHPILSCYCKKGLFRFVIGDYAWAMQEALMIGYVTHPYSFGYLSSALDEPKNKEFNIIDHSQIVGLNLYRSIHDRRFNWLENRGKACKIEVNHLWLKI